MLLTNSEASADVGSTLLRDLRPWVAALKPFTAAIPLPDSTLKFMAFDHMHRHFAVVICSPPAAPEMVARNVAHKELAQHALGPLGEVVLEPLKFGRVNGLSYAIYPYCRRLETWRLAWAVQRMWLRPALLAWLRAATRETLDDPSPEERENLFRIPLLHLASEDLVPHTIRDAASIARARLERGSWQPRVCLMHGDLWKGNVLLAPGNPGWRTFALIDWAGSLPRGHAIYDLIRVALSMGLKGRRLEQELRAHCQILKCDSVDARGYLLAALGYLGMNLGHFPFESFVALSQNCFDHLDSLGVGRGD